MYRSEVVHNISILPILQGSERIQLLGGDLDRLDEVDPADDLHAAWGGEGAGVAAVLVGVASLKGGHTINKVSNLERI